TGGLRTGKLNSRTHFSLPELRLLAQGYLEKTKLPELKGSADVDLELKWEVDRYPDILFRTRTRDVMIDKFVIGALESEGVISQESINLKRLSLSNSAGRIHLHNTQVLRQEEWKFSTTLAAEQLELRQLLMNVTVPETPLHLDIAGSLPCAGKFQPKFSINCKGQLFGSNLSVHSGEEDKFPIVDIEKFNAQGEVSVDTEKVTYKANLQVGEKSKGSSEGVIGYKTGFDINYVGDHVDFKDIKNLAKLKLEGTGRVKGNTEGNSHYATIKMDINGEDMWLENFGLGRIESEMRYKEGVLTFRKIKGLFQTSRYNGNLSINLPKNRLYITGKFPYADMEDLRSLLGRHYLLPFPVSGTGSGEIKVWGPLVLNRLNFDLRSSFYRGSLAHESFDEFIINANARDGNVKSDNIHLSKSSSRMTLNGGLSSGGHLDLVLLGRDLRLEQSENLEKLNLNMTGVLDFTTSLNGPVRHPKTDMHGRLSRLVVADRPYEDSNFKLKFTSQTIQGGGNFMGDLIQTNFILPLNDDAPFRLFAETKALNFTQLFNVFSGMSNKKDFEARLTSTVDLRSDRGGFFKSSGSIKIDDVLIRRGSISMAAPKPIVLNVNDGVFNSENFNLVGHSTYITLLAKDSSVDNLNVNVNGKVDMSLGLLFTPFLTDLRGTLSISGQLKGKFDDPELLGSAFIDNGLVRIKNFPEAVEQIRADLLFSHKNVLINAANGTLGGGPFTADGRVRINKFNEIPINIKGQFKDINLEVPKGVRTKGSGSFYVKGDWFPYSLGGELNVTYGDVTMELGGATTGPGQIKPSSFLPEFLLRDAFQPVVLDWRVNLKRPILVKNSIVDSQVDGSLRVKGKVDSPQLTGQLNLLKDGKIFFRETPFDVTTGRIEFSGEDTQNPSIFLTANSRVKDEYDISLLIQGKARDPKINLTSQPPLTESEIISLLALGIAPNAEERPFDPNELATQTTLQIGSALLQKPLGNINKLTGVEVDVSGATGADGTVVPNLTLKKQFNPKFGVSASRTVETSPTNNAKVEYKFNRNFSVLGTWENKEGTPEVKDTAADKVGIDLEYRVEFK
ncbi:MAG: translocation/assembly module TamB, partial [Bdellovibrionales bacterium]|nr:translocation/assembly module TamB [Bdellovibrionales bacterium]